MKYTYILLFLFSINYVFSQNTDSLKLNKLENQLSQVEKQKDSLNTLIESYKLKNIINQLKNIGIPKLEPTDTLITHSAMVLVYSEKYEQAKWVAHIITPDIKTGNFGRTNDFRPDTMIKTGSAVEQDYFIKELLPDSTYKYDGFGYDRGHLAPSADFRWSKKALSESYLYSNMSPQVGELNREGWAELENMLRSYVIHNNTPIFVVTGPVLNDSLIKIDRGINKVSIPKYYFKIAFDLKNKKAIAFLMPNEMLTYPVISYSKSINDIEKITGIEFFYKLPNELKENIKKQNKPRDWLVGKQKYETAPLKGKELPKNCVNTVQSYKYIDSNKKITVCGTVSSTKKTRKGHVFINLDKSFPNQIFSITIWSSNAINFSYQPNKYLVSKKVCVTGKLTDNNGIATMNIKNEKSIKVLE